MDTGDKLLMTVTEDVIKARGFGAEYCLLMIDLTCLNNIIDENYTNWVVEKYNEEKTRVMVVLDKEEETPTEQEVADLFKVDVDDLEYEIVNFLFYFDDAKTTLSKKETLIVNINYKSINAFEQVHFYMKYKNNKWTIADIELWAHS